jgi:hypothetical protein
MNNTKRIFLLSIIPFLFSVILISISNPILFEISYACYFVFWITYWGYIAYCRKPQLTKKYFWIGLGAIVVSVPLQGLIIGFAIFGIK